MNRSLAKEIHKSMSKSKQIQNRLAQEKSPYLLQHANNPVDWYPWGEEAFEKAKAQNKPIFLSIGYSTCHWCHVMAHESFENEQIAAKINEYFIPIKVDREERPDIDNIYMGAVQAMTGRGGWPLTAFLTHDKKPFYGGTYFPPYAKWGSPGLLDLMESIHNTWKNDYEKILSSSSSIVETLAANSNRGKTNATLSKDILTTSYQQFLSSYDPTWGGFGSSPKFPTTHNLSLLLRYGYRHDEQKALDMVTFTLDKMFEGGMYDHLGGGFHRYSVDRQWQIPHFEKMLYDQATISHTLLEAYQITKNENYADVTREIFDYVMRDMTDPRGGFYSAEDADSLDPYEFKDMTPDPSQSHEKIEGAFYLWKQKELKELLSDDELNVFDYRYGIEEEGNALSDPHGEFIGRNILYIKQTTEEVAQKTGKTVDEVNTLIASSKEKLFKVRNLRPRPHLDDKVLVDWNGLMISSLAYGSRVLNEEEYKVAAKRAADFILENLIDKKGRLLHRYREDEVGINGMIEDYSFFINGLLDLYEATFETKYLQSALSLAEEMIELFWDETQGGFYFTGKDQKELLFRQKEIYDGAIPSGNSMAALSLVRLYHFTLDDRWEEKLSALFDTFSDSIQEAARAYSQMLIAYDYAIGPSQEIVIASDGLSKNTFMNEIYEPFLPNKVVILHNTKDKNIVSLIPFIENQKPLQDKTTVYVCQNHVCKLPLTDKKELRDLLQSLQKD